MLTRDQILAAQDIKTEAVSVPEWPNADGSPGTVLVRGLSAADRLRIFAIKTENTDGRILWMVASCIGDEGKPLFTEADIPALLEKSTYVIERIHAAIQRVNRLGPEAVETAAKN